MQRLKIIVGRREKSGKETVKKVRKQGNTPAVVYGQDTNAMLSIPVASMKLLRSIRFSANTIIDMEITNGGKSVTMPVLIKAIQFNPVTEAISHIDFLKVSLKEKIRVHVPIVLKGEAKGIKEGEGVVAQILRELEVEGLPLDIPEKIEVDISELSLGRSLHVEDIQIPGNVRLITSPEATIVTVAAKTEEVIVEAATVEGAPPLEPEVIKEKKEVPEGEEAEGEKEAKPEKGEKAEKAEKAEKPAKPERPEKK